MADVETLKMRRTRLVDPQGDPGRQRDEHWFAKRMRDDRPKKDVLLLRNPLVRDFGLLNPLSFPDC